MTAFNTSLVHHPEVTVSAQTVSDVQEAVRSAVDRSLPVAVQATGHGMARTADGAVLINTRGLRGIEVDPAARTARVAAGTQTGELVAEVNAAGLATINGASPIVGVAGYTLGGGLGPLGRPYGYAADHVRSLEVVTAAGEVVTASPASHPDLFWAARGGRDNFGVVTSLTVDLVPVTRLYGGGIFFAGEAAPELLEAYRNWIETVPDEMASSFALLRLPPFDEIPEPIRGRFVFHLRISYTGSPEDGEALVRPLRDVAPALIDAVGEMPYADVAMIHGDPTTPGPYLARSCLLRTLSPETIQALLDFAGPGAEPPVSVVELRHLGGALARKPERPSAVGFRDAGFSVFAGGVGLPPERADAVKAGLAELVSALSPWRVGGALVCFLGPSDADPAAIEATYEPADFQRLREIKAVYDPANVFRVNHNIPPR